MRNWMDLNGDGEIDSSEMMFAGEMLCTSREEHEALFGDAGDFEDDAKDDFEIDAMAAGLDVLDVEPMSIENPLRKIKDSEKLIITPHIAWASIEARTRLMEIILGQIKEWAGIK